MTVRVYFGFQKFFIVNWFAIMFFLDTITDVIPNTAICS